MSALQLLGAAMLAVAGALELLARLSTGWRTVNFSRLAAVVLLVAGMAVLVVGIAGPDAGASALAELLPLIIVGLVVAVLFPLALIAHLQGARQKDAP